MTDEEPVFRSTREMRFRQFSEMGEERVRGQIARGRLQGQNLDLARQLLSRFDEERASIKETRRDEISEEALAEARTANRLAVQAIANAKTANTIAAIASIIAVAAIAVSMVTAFVSK